MLVFRYSARDKTGKKLEGRVEAPNVSGAARLLNNKGYIVIKLQVETGGILSVFSKIHQGISLGELSAFTRQFATMITAGITIAESLSILRDQVSKNMSPILEQILSDVESGSSLAAALGKHPNVFSPVYIALVHSGETGGILDDVLLRLADNLEKEGEFRGKLIGALIYPIIVIIGMVVVMIIMMIFVIPSLSKVYADLNAELPVTTKLLIAISGFMISYWWLVIIFSILAFFGFSMFRKSPFGARKLDEIMLRLPIIGSLQRQILLTEFTRTLGLLVGAGVSILESLSVVSKVSGNHVLGNAVSLSATDVEKGFPLAWALGQHEEIFSPMVARMIAVGEETGKTDEVLAKISHILEVESDAKVRALTSTLDPIIMVILGIGVGFIVISIILPIYNLANQF